MNDGLRFIHDYDGNIWLERTVAGHLDRPAVCFDLQSSEKRKEKMYEKVKLARVSNVFWPLA